MGEAQARATVIGVFRLQLLANGIGAAIVAVYVDALFPEAEGTDAALNLAIFIGFIALFVMVALPINMLLLRRAVIWVRQGRQPTQRQRELVFWLPAAETASAFVTWLLAAIVFGALNDEAQRASGGIALAGLVVCSALYLLLEAHFRPVFALALEGVEVPDNRREVLPRLMLAWLVGSGVPLLAIGISPFIDNSGDVEARLPWLALAGVVSGGVVMMFAAVSVSRPLNRVRGALRRVERGDLQVELTVDNRGELGRLSEGVNDLVAGLRERDNLRDLFGRQVGRSDLEHLAGDVRQGFPPGEQRSVTVMFVDLQGYTRYSEGHPPDQVVKLLNRFFGVVVAVVDREGGWINKFEGDAALCLFGAPQHEHDHAARALRAAAMLPRVLAAEADMLPAGIGVASGIVTAGFIGTSERFEYTVIGDVVNLAARLTDEAKKMPTGVLADAASMASAGTPDGWVDAGTRRVRGRSERTDVFTLRRSRRRRGRARRSSRV